MENERYNRVSIVPWLSWREYYLCSGTKTLIFEQRSHCYYLLSDEASIVWCNLCSGNINSSYQLYSLKPLIDDGIVILNNELKDEINNIRSDSGIKILKYHSIPEDFNKELREEGYVYDVHWDITNKCNAKCIHCYNQNAHNGLRNKNSVELSYEEAKQLVDEILYLGVFRLVLSGGEVLTQSYFLPLCRYIRKHNIQLIIYTNGVAFTKKILDELSSLYPSTICFSVYGDNSIIHDNITKIKGSYKKIIKALSYLKKCNIETCHKNTILTENFMYWERTLEKGKRISDKSLLNCTIYPSLDNGRMSEYCIDDDQLLKLAMSPQSPIYYKLKITGACNIRKPHNDTPCYNGTNTIYINHAGEVCLCIAFPYVIARLRDGNIRALRRNKKNNTFKNEFTALKGYEILDNWRSLKISDLKECGTYNYCEFCIDVCPGDAYVLTGDLLRAPENHCVIAKARYKAFLSNNRD